MSVVPKLLIFDTSTAEATVVVAAGEAILAEAAREVTTHSEGLLSLIDQVLGQAGLSVGELDGICVGRGPGSYTGVRIGLASAKGLCLAAGKPLFLLGSLLAPAAAVRAQLGEAPAVVTLLDARRAEVFAAYFPPAAADPLWEEVCRPEELTGLLPAIRPLIFVGDGALRYRDWIAATLPDVTLAPAACHAIRARHLLPTALEELRAGRCAGLAEAAPTYLRAPDIRPGVIAASEAAATAAAALGVRCDERQR